jgi:hypothetical protein
MRYNWYHSPIKREQHFEYGQRYFLYSTDETNYYFRFRQGPVPNIHKYKASGRSYFRTGINCLQQKKKWYEGSDQLKEYGVAIKRRRAPRSLPSDWDDIGYSHGYRSASWKNCTKKRRQWGGQIQLIYCG